jgi:hypothetical protein
MLQGDVDLRTWVRAGLGQRPRWWREVARWTEERREQWAERAAIPHTWVEIPGGIVFDPVDQLFFTRDGYYQTLHAKAEAHYTMAEAGQRAVTTKHYGPWHETTA